MNDNDLMNNNSASSTNTYRATKNLNTAIENPRINMISAVDINIKDVGVNNSADTNSFSSVSFDPYSSNMVNTNLNVSPALESSFSSNNFTVKEDTSLNEGNNNIQFDGTSTNLGTNNQFVTESLKSDSSEVDNQYTPSLNDSNVEYEPTLKEKKTQKEFTFPRELKILLFIVLILVIFILLIPYIYDFLEQIQLSFVRE